MTVTPTPSVTRTIPADEIRIDHLILHYLDHKAGDYQLVDVEPPLDQPELSELVHGRYAQYLSYAEQNADWIAEFGDSTRSVSSHCLSILRSLDDFVDVSKQLALKLYDAMRLGSDLIVPGDLVVILYHTGDITSSPLAQQIALLKVNPDSKQLSRTLVNRAGRTEVEFQRSTNTLPGVDSLQKCALIALSDDGVGAESHFDLRLLDKQAGSSSPGIATFFYRDFLGASLSSSARRQTRLFLKATNAWLDKHVRELSPTEVKRFLRVRRTLLQQTLLDLRLFVSAALEGHQESANDLLAYVIGQVFEGEPPILDNPVMRTDQR
ncbi:MAG: nucleoid-associated protein, partial [Ktedonobacterales bacterium]